MILGIGSDLCNIERIRASLDRFGTRFEAKAFTDAEIAKANRRPHTRAATFAKRFAAKEAFSKAVGTGFKSGVFLKDIGVVNAPSGAPTLALSLADDRFETLDAARHIAASVPGAQLISFPSGGHVWVGRNEQVFAAVEGFLRRLT